VTSATVPGLGSATWPELDERRPTVLVPVGSVEQHGPHLPLDTDTVIATATAERVAHQLAQQLPLDVQVAPPVTYGASGEHQRFPGTTSIGTEALSHLLVELIRSLSCWAGPVLLVNGHGGNVHALDHAVGLLRSENRQVAWLPCGPADGDAHAGHVETSLMLHLAPHRARLDRATPGNSTPLRELLPALMRDGVRAVSPTGVLGNPMGASAGAGALIFKHMVDDATAKSVRALQQLAHVRQQVGAGRDG
jgi:creatinine amidohydrolase